MKNWMKLGMLLPGFLAVALVLPIAGADEKDRKEDKKEDKKDEPKEGIIIIDSRGKENKIKSWEIIAGTRRLGWLAPPEPEKKPQDRPEDKENPDAPPRGKPVRVAPPAQRGPEALAFRDENSTVWANGVLTLIPLDRLRGIDFDNEEQKMTVKVAGAKADEDVTLTGTTRFAGSNKLTIEAEIDKGELGVASIKYLGGVKNGIKGIRFPAPKPLAPTPARRAADVTIRQDENKKTTEKVTDLQALYLTGGGEKLSPILFFKKTIKLDVAKATKLVAVDDKGKDWTVTLKDGNEETLTLLDNGELDGKTAVLRGFVAKVPAGWKLFPLSIVAEISFEGAKT